ncbi:MAG: SDR family oxidoreductase [Sphingobacteriia bacterium]|nr:MAG: SDR family oxidoreductase [Sphingobacteriia bacterium]
MQYALITGASKGIGKAMAVEMAKRGYGVLLVARSEFLLQQNCIELNELYKVPAQFLAIDLTDPTATQTIFNWCINNHYEVSVLINNAGYGLNGSLEDYSLYNHLQMMQLNMNVVVALCYLFLPELKKRKVAYIGNISSTAAYQSVPGLNIYAASKTFVRSFSRGLAYELRNTSVKVCCICPGTTDTDFAQRANITHEKAMKMAAKFNMNPVDVAKQAVDGILAGKKEIVPGATNKVLKCLLNIVPDSFLEQSAAGIYGI